MSEDTELPQDGGTEGDEGCDDAIIDTTQQEERVKIRGRTGEVKEYLLREMMGLERDRYLRFSFAKATTTKTGGMKLDNADDLQADLISRCLFDPDDNKKVNIAVIRTWSSSAQQKLYHKCRRMNGLDEEAEEKAKKG